MTSTKHDGAGRSLLPIQVQPTWLMIDAAYVREALGARTWVAIPGASSEIPGVVAWRGRAVAVLDLATLVVGVRPLAAKETRARTIVLEVDGSLLALLVDAAREVQEIPKEQFRAPHATAQPLASFEVTFAGTVMPVLNLSATLERLSFRAQRSA